jgi:hypothetical protein
MYLTTQMFCKGLHCMARRNITEVFDPANTEHLISFKVFHKLGKRTGVLADPGVSFPIGWKLQLILQVIEYVIQLLLGKKPQNP